MPSPESKIYANNNANNQQEITAVTAADKAAFAGEEDGVHHPETTPEERQLQQQGEPNRYDAVAQGEAAYWSKFGQAYAASDKAQAWMNWMQQRGYVPQPDTASAAGAAAGVPQKDAASDWTNYGNSWQGKGNSMGQGWVDWAQRQGYVPQPAAAAGGNGGAAPAGPGQQRRLDAFDDRMARYEAIGKFEESYWKARGDAWAQWAIEEGYAPSPDSKYAAEFRAQALGQAPATPTFTAATAATAATAGVSLPETTTSDKRFTDLSAEDKAEAIRGDFYKERKSWADWLRDRTFGDDVAVVGSEVYPPTEGFKGPDGPVRAFIAEKLHMTNVEATGEVSPATFADVNMNSNKAQEDVYKYDTFVGRSATRAFNGMANGAEHVAKAAERTAERTYTMAGSRMSDAKDAYDQATDSTKPAVAEAEKAAIPATPAVPVAAPKHKNMRGVAH